ncbi:MAG: hypothetical protein COA38_14665 [Fluviicola sp.]|nr:MAG: hypothetical protein COA38_14665 [Fluviicola sp.]
MSHVEKIETVKLELSSKDGKKLGYVKNNGVGSKSTMIITENIDDATIFDVMTYDKHTQNLKDPCYYKLKNDPKYYLDMHQNSKAIKQNLFADKPNFSVSASTIASWTLNEYLETRIGGYCLGQIEGNENLLAVLGKSKALLVKAIHVK